MILTQILPFYGINSNFRITLYVNAKTIWPVSNSDKIPKVLEFFHGIKPNNLDEPYLGSTNLSKTKK